MIAKPILREFWTKHPDSEESLKYCFRLLQKHDFGSFHELKEKFTSVDQVKGLTVFNIGGNKYRLIAHVLYERKRIYIRAIMKHSEYDLGKWRVIN